MSYPDPHKQLANVADDAISLFDLWRIIRSGWRWIVVTMAIALAMAGGFLLVTPPQYEARSIIQATRLVINGDQIQTAGFTSQVLVEYLAFPSFRADIIRRLGWDPEDRRATVFLDSPRPSSKANTDVIELRVRGLTEADASAGMLATIDALAEMRWNMIKPVLERQEVRLKAIQREKDETQHLLKRYDGIVGLQTRTEPYDRFSKSLLYLQKVTAQQDRLTDLANRENDLRDNINRIRESRLQPMIEPNVSKKPVFPKPYLVLAIAVLGGAFLGLLGAVLRPVWQAQRASTCTARESGNL